MSLRSQAGRLRRKIHSAVQRRPVSLGALGGIVTFSFDDFPRSAWTVGGEILERYGARATYYVSMNLMGCANDLGEQFRREDLFSLSDRGHEIASHTFSHLSARRVNANTFLHDVERGERAIAETMGFPASGNFAYPYGDVRIDVKKKLGAELTSCRGTCGGLNGPEVDLNLLFANSLYGGMDRADAAKQMILENEKERGWLIFYSHDVAERPSRFGCTPELLNAVCSFAGSRGARFLTVAQVMTELGEKTGGPVGKRSQTEFAQPREVPLAYSVRRSAESRG